MADLARGVDGRRVAIECREIIAEALEELPTGLADEVERGRRAAADFERCEADAGSSRSRPS
jgi:hypothetical protein